MKRILTLLMCAAVVFSALPIDDYNADGVCNVGDLVRVKKLLAV